MARKPVDKVSPPSGNDVLIRAVSHPTRENVSAALSHPDLKDALDGLNEDDFKSISTIVGPYVLLRNALQFRNKRDLFAAAVDPRLSAVLSKLDGEDLEAIHNALGGDEARVPCH